MSDSGYPTCVYVGCLDHSVTEELLFTLFSCIGPLKSCKVIREPGNDPYAFVDFEDHQDAITALSTMNKRVFLDKEIRVNWAFGFKGRSKIEYTDNHYHVLVIGLSPDIQSYHLRYAFSPFGEISSCRIIKNARTLKSKGYGFVSFVEKADAENALHTMNGQFIGSRIIKTKWATKGRRTQRISRFRFANMKMLTFEEVYNQSSPTNRTVYCSGFVNGTSEDSIKKLFSQFGVIENIRCFEDKRFALIKFTTKEAATRAIESVHHMEIDGQLIKCFWRRETPDSNAANNTAYQVRAPPQWPYPWDNMEYCYPPGHVAIPTASVQEQYLEGMHLYPYGQFGYPQNHIGGVWYHGTSNPWPKPAEPSTRRQTLFKPFIHKREVLYNTNVSK